MRTKNKLDYIMWFVITLLPIIIYLILGWQGGFDVSFSTFLTDYRFDFVADILIDVLEVVNLQFSPLLVSLISYMASVEIVHVFYDFIVFIPRMAHNLMGDLYAK